MEYGKNLLDLIGLDRWDKNSIYSEVSGDDGLFLACFREKDFKLIWDSKNDKFELYNISTDPGESENLFYKLPEFSEKIRLKFLNFLGYSNLSDLRPNLEIEIDKKMEEKLRALGYIK